VTMWSEIKHVISRARRREQRWQAAIEYGYALYLTDQWSMSEALINSSILKLKSVICHLRPFYIPKN